MVLGYQLEAVPQRGQHAETEQVELDQARVRAVVLVPLEHGAIRHPRPLDRAHLADRPVADHHPARVDAEVPGELLHAFGQFDDRLRDAGIGRNRLSGRVRARADLLGPLVLLLRGVAKRSASVADRHPRPVRDHVGDLRGLAPAVGAVDVLDDLLAPLVLDIQVDVGRTVPSG